MMTTYPQFAAAVLTALSIAACGITDAPPPPSPPPAGGVMSFTISEKTLAGTDYVLKQITIPPGGSTGWHFHPGPVIGYVKSGTLTHYRSDCTQDGVYTEGQSIAEQSGDDYVHIGRNLGPSSLLLVVLYQNPSGEQLAVEVPHAACP